MAGVDWSCPPAEGELGDEMCGLLAESYSIRRRTGDGVRTLDARSGIARSAIREAAERRTHELLEEVGVA